MTQINGTYISPNWSAFRGLWWIITIVLLVAVVVLWLLGYCPGGERCPEVVETVDKIVEVAKIKDIPAKTIAVGKRGTIPNTIRLYFAAESTKPAAHAKLSIEPVISFLRDYSEAMAIVSSFHSSQDNDSKKGLAQARSDAACKLLKDAGISEDRIFINEPVETTHASELNNPNRIEIRVKF